MVRAPNRCCAWRAKVGRARRRREIASQAGAAIVSRSETRQESAVDGNYYVQ